MVHCRSGSLDMPLNNNNEEGIKSPKKVKIRIKKEDPVTTPSMSNHSSTSLMPPPPPKSVKTPGSGRSRPRKRKRGELMKSIEKVLTPAYLPSEQVKAIEFEIDGHFTSVGINDPIPIIYVKSDRLSPGSPQGKHKKGSKSRSSTASPEPLNSPVSSHSSTSNKNRMGKRRLTDNVRHKIEMCAQYGSLARCLSSYGQHKVRIPEPVFKILDADSGDLLPELCVEAPPLPSKYIVHSSDPATIEYDLDDEDIAWLSLQNETRRRQRERLIKAETMQYLLDTFEKESYFVRVNSGQMDGIDFSDESSNCYICLEGESDNVNQIVFCELCNLAVHQECYGTPYIPEGPWLCGPCIKSPSKEVLCSLCPKRGGALKQTEDGRWAHVLCALAIPEIFFANPAFLEPFLGLKGIPAKRWKLRCSICRLKSGACVQCQFEGCQKAFHAICAQEEGLARLAKTGDQGSYLTHFELICAEHRTEEAFHDFRFKKLVPMTLRRRSIHFQLVPKLADDAFQQILANIKEFIPKPSFVKHLRRYWLLKRQSRSGVPLIVHQQFKKTLLKKDDSSPLKSPKSPKKRTSSTVSTASSNLNS